AAVLILAAYRRGALDSAGYLGERYRSLLSRAGVGSAAWIFDRLVRADIYLAHGIPWKAAGVLWQSRDALRKARDGTRELSLRRVVFLSAGLLLHLDWAEERGEHME